ncbi:hypothetical protein PYR78_02340 [Acinetobacter johnsonii]|nr:hypothetical protein PYR78_02340 [Acinetobacter johnsonii]
MIFRIKNKHALAFMIWLELLGYVKKVLSDGSCTFSGKGTKKSLSYVFVKNDLTGNAACQTLYEEYVNYQESNYIDMKVAG